MAVGTSQIDPVQAIVLGVVQGLTEWLPISSTAHLRIVPEFLGWNDPGAAFTAAIQIGTMLAVLVYFAADILRVLKGFLKGLADKGARSRVEYDMGWGIVIGTLPIIVLGLLFKDQIETSLRSLYVVASALIIMGVVFLIADQVGSKRRTFEQVKFRDGLWVGLWQAIALIPGASRSGSTISGALFAGLDRPTAARFSFLLSIPSILAAGIWSLVSHREDLFGGDMAPMLIANGVSFVVGLFSIALLMKVLEKFGAMIFVVYRVVLGTVLVVLLANGRLQAEPHTVQDVSAISAVSQGGHVSP